MGRPHMEMGLENSKWADDENDKWSTKTWWERDDDDRDRPYLSHFAAPTFDGKKDNYAEYAYTVLNLKSQCGSKHHIYLAPRLISNFKGTMRDDACSIGA